MTIEEILKKSIEKAVKNGYPKIPSKFFTGKSLLEWIKSDWSNEPFILGKNYYGFVFSHEFAKAFWGEEMVHYDDEGKLECHDHIGKSYFKVGYIKIVTGVCSCCTGFDEVYVPAWQFHLQQMVLEENPYEYLGKFL